MALTREQAWELLNEYNKGEFHLKHGQIVGDVMRWYANELGYGDEADFWETVGLLHDLDFEMYPDEHCIKSQEIMREKGLDERLIRATASHGYGLHFDGLPEPQHEMEKVLFAADELTGLIGAVALMRPSKSVDDLEVKSVKKKYKDKKFAAGCSREVIERGAEMLGWDLDTLIERTILAMRASEHVSAELADEWLATGRFVESDGALYAAWADRGSDITIMGDEMEVTIIGSSGILTQHITRGDWSDDAQAFVPTDTVDTYEYPFTLVNGHAVFSAFPCPY